MKDMGSNTYIVKSIEKDTAEKLRQANEVIKNFVSQFDRPEFICPELVEYLKKK